MDTNTYIAKFIGRKSGSIGKVYRIEHKFKWREEYNYDEMREYLYIIGYEHIRKLSFEKVLDKE